MLHYADQLTTEPWAVAAEDIAGMRDAGLSDRDILDVAQVVGYYAYANRIASGLGVEIED